MFSYGDSFNKCLWSQAWKRGELAFRWVPVAVQLTPREKEESGKEEVIFMALELPGRPSGENRATRSAVCLQVPPGGCTENRPGLRLASGFPAWVGGVLGGSIVESSRCF